MIVITTERLLLKQASLNDSHFFFTLLNSPGWLTYIGDRGIKTLDDAEHYIQNSLVKSYKENGFGLYKIILKAKNQPIGLCGLVKRPELENPDIGFALLPGYERNGYAFEAAKATMAYARLKLGLNVILGITKEDNTKSKKLLEKIGLKQINAIKFGKDKEPLLLYANEKT